MNKPQKPNPREHIAEGASYGQGFGAERKFVLLAQNRAAGHTQALVAKALLREFYGRKIFRATYKTFILQCTRNRCAPQRPPHVMFAPRSSPFSMLSAHTQLKFAQPQERPGTEATVHVLAL